MKSDISGKTTDLPHVTDKLYYVMLNRIHLAMNEIQKPNVGGARVDCTGSSKSNYHAITIMMSPARIYMHDDYVLIKYATLGIVTRQ